MALNNSFRAASIIGYLPSEVIGCSAYDFYHLDDLSILSVNHKNCEYFPGPHLICVYYFTFKFFLSFYWFLIWEK